MSNNKERGLFPFIGGFLALALPCLALGGAPSPAVCGELGALGKYCSTLEPGLQAAGDKFLQEMRQLVPHGAGESQSFDEAYDQMSQALVKLDRQTGLALCGFAPATASGGGDRDGDHDRDQNRDRDHVIHDR